MSHMTEAFSLLKIPHIDAASILGSSKGHVILFFPSCFLLWALFLSFSFTHMTLLCCYLKLPFECGRKECLCLDLLLHPSTLPSLFPSLSPSSLPSTSHPPSILPFRPSILPSSLTSMVGGGGRGHLLSPVKVRQIMCVWGWWRLENYSLLVWVAAAQTTLHLTAIFTPAAFFRLGIVSRQRQGLHCCWGVSVLLDMMCSIKVGAAQAPPSGREAAHT